MVENRFVSNIFNQTQINDFRLQRVDSQRENTYRIPRLLPHVRPLRRQTEGRLQITSRESMNRLVGEIFDDAEHMGLEMGKRNAAVRVLRMSGLNYGETAEQADLVPQSVKMKIDDGKGNRVTFHMSYEIGYVDGENREWDKVIVRMDQANLEGRRVQLTPEMKREGFTFLTHDMPKILASAKTDSPQSARVRQETPDASCFIDGHKASGGKHELGCSCREERAESLAVIYANGGINCLMPGTGNGNGSEAQDRQITSRNAAARRGRRIISYHNVYDMMGKHPDNRGDALTMSTFIMENLFRFREIQDITVLSDSSRKRDTWNTFREGRTITQQPLESAKRDNLDFQSKADNHGYATPTEFATQTMTH